MYRSLSIKNFRGFQEISIDPLDRINLIAGKNNLGKTAILEALFLHLGPNNAELGLRLNAFRGIEKVQANPDEIWGWLFYGRKTDQSIVISSGDEKKITQTLCIKLGESNHVPVTTSGSRKSGTITIGTTSVSVPELILEYSNSNGESGRSRGYVTAEGEIRLERAELIPKTFGVYIGTRTRVPFEDAERYSQLETVGRQDEVLESLKIIEPRLKRLAVVVTGGLPMINGDIGIGRLVPLPFLGEGTVRLLEILLAISTTRDGVVLIDEIENGLHYSVLKKVWKAIAQYARKSNTQIVTTTHSWESIEAAHLAFSEDDVYDFRLHRLECINDIISAITYDKDLLSASMKAQLEVR